MSKDCFAQISMPRSEFDEFMIMNREKDRDIARLKAENRRFKENCKCGVLCNDERICADCGTIHKMKEINRWEGEEWYCNDCLNDPNNCWSEVQKNET